MLDLTTLKEGVYDDLTSDEYHGLSGTYSSSQLKELEDPEYFYQKHILKTIPRKSIPAFDVGTYFHTLILEPHLIESECAVFKGVRRGKEWDAFQATHAGKTIITDTEFTIVTRLADAVRNSPVGMGFVKRGKPEISAFIKICVYNGEIYAGGDKRLTIEGWVETERYPAADMGVWIWLKVRADSLGEDFVADLKSTTGNTKDEKLMRNKIFDLNYHLSAALYLDVFEIALKRPMKKFVWIWASKDVFNSKSYVGSVDLIKIGRKRWMNAVHALARGLNTGWDFPDYLAELDAPVWEMDILKPKAEDAL